MMSIGASLGSRTLVPAFAGLSPSRRKLLDDLPASGLPTAESRPAVRLPKHRRRVISDRAHEVPLIKIAELDTCGLVRSAPATEMPGARKKD